MKIMTMMVDELCKKYGFSYVEFPDLIRITSKNDAWYIPNLESYKNAKLRLYHESKLGDKFWHRQFKNNKIKIQSLEGIFVYINNHDHKYIVK